MEVLRSLSKESQPIKKKEVRAFPNVLFRKLAKFDEKYLLSKSQEILNKKLSMKTVIDDCITSVARSHMLALIQKKLGFSTLEDIAIAYPGKEMSGNCHQTEAMVIGFVERGVGEEEIGFSHSFLFCSRFDIFIYIFILIVFSLSSQ